LLEFQQLRDGSFLRLESQVSFDGTNSEQNAITFPLRTYEIKAVEDVKPAITSVKNTLGTEIPNAGFTGDTAVTISGAASKGQNIELFDGTVSNGNVSVDLSGVWRKSLAGLESGRHLIIAKALYGSRFESDLRTFTIEPLTVPNPTITLSGWRIRGNLTSWPPTGLDAIGNTAVLTPQGGLKPYTFTSNSIVAKVDANGKISGEFNGTAIITVTDSARSSVNCTVVVSNVWGPHVTQLANFDANMTEMYRYGGRPILADGMALINRLYSPQSLGGWYWALESVDANTAKSFYPNGKLVYGPDKAKTLTAGAYYLLPLNL